MPKTQQPLRRVVSPNNPVRRRLFPTSETDDARKENFTNAMNESLARETLEKSLKWNFDFKNDTPLNHSNGAVEWFVDDARQELLGKIKSPLSEVEIQEVNIQEENETTPKVKEETRRAPVIRKRKSESDTHETDKGIRRKISFD